MAYSNIGKRRLALHGMLIVPKFYINADNAAVILFVINIIVLALAARVNQFQEFFCMSPTHTPSCILTHHRTVVADLFPLALSIITLVYLSLSLLLDLGLENPFTAKAHFEIGAFGLLSVFWLGE
jgi:hypothetical protein